MKKMRNNEGFTLAELLIVVAIIAVLVAVSIPIFTRQLEKSREATDRANFRAAKAAAITQLLDDSTINDEVFYDAAQGILVKAQPATGYGKGTTLKATDKDEYDPSLEYKDGVIKVKFKDGKVTLSWTKGDTTGVTIDPAMDVFYSKS